MLHHSSSLDFFYQSRVVASYIDHGFDGFLFDKLEYFRMSEFPKFKSGIIFKNWFILSGCHVCEIPSKSIISADIGVCL
jgi:hypothetical protein